MNYNAAYKYLISRLEKELPNNLHYHGIHHTLNVVNTAELIGKSENLSKEELILIKTGALYHDSGFLFNYFDNEKLAMELAQQTLPLFEYNAEEIKIINGIIEATILCVKPKNLLQRIMIDSDFDYFGKEGFDPISDSLLAELNKHGDNFTKKQWDKIQIEFLGNHRYYTNFSLKNRLPKKKENLLRIKERFENYS